MSTDAATEGSSKAYGSEQIQVSEYPVAKVLVFSLIDSNLIYFLVDYYYY